MGAWKHVEAIVSSITRQILRRPYLMPSVGILYKDSLRGGLGLLHASEEIGGLGKSNIGVIGTESVE
jgi:hypothetical protein